MSTEEPGDIQAAIERTKDGYVPVDTASLLVVDPCHIPAALLESLTAEGLAVVVGTRADGVYWADFDDEHQELVVWRDMSIYDKAPVGVCTHTHACEHDA
jgi:hypothetical protein